MSTAKRKHSISFDPKENRTKQSNRNETDVNFIVNAHLKKGIALPEAPPPIFGDVADFEFQHSQDLIANIRSEFNELPARTRAHFGNDVANYHVFMVDPNNRLAIDENGYDTVMTDLMNPPEETEEIAEIVPKPIPDVAEPGTEDPQS